VFDRSKAAILYDAGIVDGGYNPVWREDHSMKRLLAGMIALGLFAGCSDNGAGSNGSTGRVSVEAFDAPPIMDYNVESVLLTVETITALNTETDEWDTLGTPHETLDFLELVNGATSIVADTSLPVGQYSQIRMVVSEENTIIVDGVEKSLRVPSGTESGVKVHVDFDIDENGETKLFIDFDVAKSITVTGGPSPQFSLRPSYKAFTQASSGVISGTVANDAGAGIEHAMVSASADGDTTNTFTDEVGGYSLTLPVGTYDLSANEKQGASPDTTYTAVVLDSGVELTDYNFTLR
jgi:hypothetical protein